MIPRVETGGAFSDFSILDRYPLEKPVCSASFSRVRRFSFRKALIRFPISPSMMGGCFIYGNKAPFGTVFFY
jgi:hypothetical protein